MQDTKVKSNFKMENCEAFFSVKDEIFWYHQGGGKKGLFSSWKCFGDK